MASNKYDSADDVNALKKLTSRSDELTEQMRAIKEEIDSRAGDLIEQMRVLFEEREKLDDPVTRRIQIILQSGGTAEDLINGGIDPQLAHKMFRAVNDITSSLGGIFGIIIGGGE